MRSFMSFTLLGKYKYPLRNLQGLIKEDNRFKPYSCWVKNNTNICSPRKFLSFVNQENEEKQNLIHDKF